MIRAACLVGPALALAALSAPGAAANEAGEGAADSCLACHAGPVGKHGNIPSLDGLGAAGIANAMREFRSGARESTIMGRLAKGFTDLEIDEVARAVAAHAGQGRSR